MTVTALAEKAIVRGELLDPRERQQIQDFFRQGEAAGFTEAELVSAVLRPVIRQKHCDCPSCSCRRRNW